MQGFHLEIGHQNSSLSNDHQVDIPCMLERPFPHSCSSRNQFIAGFSSLVQNQIW